MISSKTKIKTKIFATLVAIFMILVNGGLVLFQASKLGIDSIVKASDYAPTEVSISNADFQSPSSGSYPLSPSSWTEMNKTGNVTAGIISLDSTFVEKQEKDYKLSFQPRDYASMADKQVLMINSADTLASAGYKSSSFSLSSNGYYAISFWAYTENTAKHTARATAKLSGDDKIEANKNNILSINTSDGNTSNWKEYKIFVQTDDINSLSLNLEFWLGEQNGNKSYGAVFFDNVRILSYDQKTFEIAKKNADPKTSTILSNYVGEISNFVENQNFENGLAGWSLSKDSSSTAGNFSITDVVYINSENYNSSLTKIEDVPGDANILNNKKALLINNLQAGHVGYESKYFTIKQNRLYKLSFLAKTGAIDGSATVKLVERNPYTNEKLSDGTTNPNYYKDSKYEAQTFTISDISTNDYTNSKTGNWKQYSFYIKGSSYFDSEVNLELWLGTTDKDATGYVFFDQFSLQQITSSDYSNGSSNGTVANLSQSTTETDFVNGTFNNVKIENIYDTAPFAPENWALTKSNSNALSKNGVINTSKDYSSIGIPTVKPIDNQFSNNNVLMIGNISSNLQKYTSKTVKLIADGYYKISVSVLTNNLNGAYAGIRLVSDGTVIGEKLNISCDDWTTYSFLVKTGMDDRTISMELSLGQTSEGTGFAFFDNVIMKSSLTEDDFNSVAVNEKQINLSNYTFENTSEEPTNGIYTSYDFNGELKGKANDSANVDSGVVDATKYGTPSGYNGSATTNPGQGVGKVLMISSNVDDVWYSFTSTLSNSLSSGNYYKVEVTLKTANLSQDEANKKLKANSETEYVPYGASISLDGISASFSGIDTENEYKTYTIYINCTTNAEIKLILGLGSENAMTSGTVFFSNASVTKIDQSAYKDCIAVLENEDVDNVLAIGNTDVAEDDNNNDDNKSSDVNFDWLLVPSIITALAVIIAVVGVLVRKLRKNAPKKPVDTRPYSKENLKKLNSSYKTNIKNINKQIVDTKAEQNKLAIEINELKQKQDYASKKLLEEKQKQYDENNQKLVSLNAEKENSSVAHKEKLASLEQEKSADKKMRKSK